MRTARLRIVSGGGEVLSGGGARYCDLVPGGREVLWPGPGGEGGVVTWSVREGDVVRGGRWGVVPGRGRCCDLVPGGRREVLWPGPRGKKVLWPGPRGEGGRFWALLPPPLTMWPIPWCIWCNTFPSPNVTDMTDACKNITFARFAGGNKPVCC